MAWGKASDTEITLSSAIVNRWEIAWYRVDNVVNVTGQTGTVLTVQLCIFHREAGDGSVSNFNNINQVTYTGTDLEEIMTQAGEYYEAWRVTEDEMTSWANATRDAIFARIYADGVLIPHGFDLNSVSSTIP